MSHLLEVAVEFRDFAALQAACDTLGYPITLGNQSVRIYRTDVQAIASVRPTGWMYPMAIKADGSVSYDLYRGNTDANFTAWGDRAMFDALEREYTAQIFTKVYKANGYIVSRKAKSITAIKGSETIAMDLVKSIVSVNGVAGKTCVKSTEKLKQALGKSKKETKTGDYWINDNRVNERVI